MIVFSDALRSRVTSTDQQRLVVALYDAAKKATAASRRSNGGLGAEGHGNDRSAG